MGNIIKIFKTDFKNLITNFFPLVIAIGVCILPSLYAWFNIYSNWDPYANTSNIKIAVVNLDEGYEKEDGTVENLGDSVVESLKENTAIGWTFLDSDKEAIDGVESGEYYAAVVINDDFSSVVYNVLNQDIQNPTIIYYENEKKNAVATKITDTAVSTLKSNINKEFIRVAVETLFTKTNELTESLSEDEEMQKFLDRLNEINDNLMEYDSMIDGFIAANNTLSGEIASAKSKLPSLINNLSATAVSMQNAGNSINGTQAALQEFSSQMNASMNGVQASLNAITNDINNAGLAQSAAATADAVSQTKKDIIDFSSKLDQISVSLAEILAKGALDSAVQNGTINPGNNETTPANATVPSIEIPTFTIPETSETNSSSEIQTTVPQITVPQITVPETSGTENTTIPTFTLPDITIPDAIVPSVSETENITIPSVRETEKATQPTATTAPSSSEAEKATQPIATTAPSSNEAESTTEPTFTVPEITLPEITLPIQTENILPSSADSTEDDTELNRSGLISHIVRAEGDSSENESSSGMSISPEDIESIADVFATAENVSADKGQIEEIISNYVDSGTIDQAAANAAGLDADTVKQIKRAIETIAFLRKQCSEIVSSLEQSQITSSGSTIENSINSNVNSANNALNSCNDMIESLQNTYNQTLVPEMGSVLTGMSSSMGQAAQMLNDMTRLVNNMQYVFSGIQTTMDSANYSLTGAKAAIKRISDKFSAMVDIINSVDEDERYQAIIDFFGGNPEDYADFLSEPVYVTTEAVYPVENYGSAVAPFYTVLALWVGAIILVAIINVKAEPHGLVDVKPYQLFFGRYIMFFLLGQLQAVIVVLGNMYLLNCQILYPGKYFLIASITSFTFTLLIYSLTISFGDIGKAIAVVVMVLQIAGSGGTYPIEILPEFYQRVYIFFPFPYAIAAFRETIAGMYESVYLISILELLIFAVAAVLLGLIIRIPFIRLNHFVEKRMEDTKLM